jgi:hypothetical protein
MINDWLARVVAAAGVSVSHPPPLLSSSNNSRVEDPSRHLNVNAAGFMMGSMQWSRDAALKTLALMQREHDCSGGVD